MGSPPARCSSHRGAICSPILQDVSLRPKMPCISCTCGPAAAGSYEALGAPTLCFPRRGDLKRYSRTPPGRADSDAVAYPVDPVQRRDLQRVEAVDLLSSCLVQQLQALTISMRLLLEPDPWLTLQSATPEARYSFARLARCSPGKTRSHVRQIPTSLRGVAVRRLVLLGKPAELRVQYTVVRRRCLPRQGWTSPAASALGSDTYGSALMWQSRGSMYRFALQSQH